MKKWSPHSLSFPPFLPLAGCMPLRARAVLSLAPRDLAYVRRSARNSGLRWYVVGFTAAGAAAASGIRSWRMVLAYPVQSV
jgi:hypothetical protein